MLHPRFPGRLCGVSDLGRHVKYARLSCRNPLVRGFPGDVVGQVRIDILSALVALPLHERRQVLRVVIRKVARLLAGLVVALQPLGLAAAVDQACSEVYT